jgi:uncharacterized protein (TIGR03437 family)
VLKAIVTLAWGAAPGLFAQTAELPFFWAYLRSPAQPESWVVADLRVHVLRDAGGAIDSGGSCVRLRYNLRDPLTLTALRIHRATDGSVVVQGTFPSTVVRGAGSVVAGINDKIQVRRGDRQALEALRRFLEDPFGHYVTLATQEQPEGSFRGPIWKTEHTVLMSLASADPAIPAERRAGAALEVDAFLTRDSSGKVVFGEVMGMGTYHYPAQVTFTGLHIRSGPDGTGPIVISTPLAAAVSAATGSGDLTGYWTQIHPENETALRTLLEIVRAPENFSITLQAGTQPEGTVRGRLRRTHRTTFLLQFNARNVVPPQANWESWSTAVQTFFTLRREDGSIAAATLLYQAQFRFPEPCELRFRGFRRGRAGTNGPVVYEISSTPSLTSTGHFDGAGIQYQHFDEGDLNNFLNDLVDRPEEYYMEVSTDKGAVRAQFSTVTQLPAIDAVVSANLDPASRTLAPGALISIFGRNLAKVGTDLSGWEGTVIPESLNSVAVGAGPHRARLLYVSPAQINAQLPFELAPGTHGLAVNNGNGMSNIFAIPVAALAPAVFSGAILKRADNSLVTAANPAQAGDVLVVYVTGMGQTTPALATGRLVDPGRMFSTVAATATVGGKDAEVLSSTAAPGFPGVYQVALRVPAGAGTGSVPLVLKAGTASSNAVSVAVR